MKTAEEILLEKHINPVSVGPDQTIAAAIDKMNQANIGAILVEKEGNIIGIWTERDLLHAVARPEFQPAAAVMRDHMRTNLRWAEHSTPLMQLEEMFLGLFIRHILVRRENRFIGLLSIGDVLRSSLLEKDAQLKKLNTVASWQYYENWGWDRKKRRQQS